MTALYPGRTELFGTFSYTATAGKPAPLFVTEDASAFVFFNKVCYTGDPFTTLTRETRAGATRTVERVEACRLWLPAENESWRVLLPQPWGTNLSRVPADGIVPAHDRGGRVSSKVGETNPQQSEAFLKTLRRMHVNTAHIADVPGYTDRTDPDALYTRYPLKYFNKLQPFTHYDTEVMLPRIHAVEFLGEPQYGGGRPVPPQEVWQALAPYAATRLPTSVMHSEERLWRFYAGLSDYPHYDAYRVSTPSADAGGHVVIAVPGRGREVRRTDADSYQAHANAFFGIGQTLHHRLPPVPREPADVLARAMFQRGAEAENGLERPARVHVNRCHCSAWRGSPVHGRLQG